MNHIDDPSAPSEAIHATTSAATAMTIRHAVYSCPIDHEGNTVVIKGWFAPQPNDLSIIVLHDVGESASGMDGFAEALAGRGYRVYSFDMRGFSDRKRAATDKGTHFRALALDLLQVVAWIKHKAQGRKPLVIGQGLGALVSLYFAKTYQRYCFGFVLVSPIINLGDKVTPLNRFLIRFLVEIIPNVALPARLCPAFSYYFSENGRLLKKQRKISIRLTHELLMIMPQFKKLLHRLKLPALIICPDEDQLYKYEGIKRALAKHPHRELMTLHFIETREHDLLSCGDEYLPEVVERIGQWLESVNSVIASTEQQEGESPGLEHHQNGEVVRS